MKKYKFEIALSVIGFVLTVLARNYAVTRRLTMGLNPSWGGEYLIIPLMLVIYAALKADWSVE